MLDLKDCIKEKIVGLYPEHYDYIISSIARICAKYERKVKKNYRQINQTDCMLICYADSIKSGNYTPLSVLKNFADLNLKGKTSALHILPFYPFTSDDGFSVTDYYAVNKDFGSWEEIRNLADNFDLMFDGVINHISKSSDWVRGFLEGKPEYSNLCVEVDPMADTRTVVRPRALPLLHKYNKCGEDVWLWTTFSEDQLDLNYANPDVFLRILDVLLFYVTHGARFIRLDAIGFMWKILGTSCIHLPETHDIIKIYRAIIEGLDPSVVLITETNVPHIENISYFGNGTDEAHQVYNFTLPPLLFYSIIKEDISVFIEWAKSLDFSSKHTTFFNFTASHDGIGVRPLQGILPIEEIELLANTVKEHGGLVSYKDNGDGTQSPYELNCNYYNALSHQDLPEKLKIKKFLLTQSVMLCMPGMPGIYYHSLLGSTNDMTGVENSGINRRINREKLDYELLIQQLEDPNHLRHKIFSEYSKMLEVRRSLPCFSPFSEVEFRKVGSVLVIIRHDGDKTIWALHNFSSKSQVIEGYAEKVFSLLEDKNLSSTTWDLEPFERKWLLG